MNKYFYLQKYDNNNLYYPQIFSQKNLSKS